MIETALVGRASSRVTRGEQEPGARVVRPAEAGVTARAPILGRTPLRHCCLVAAALALGLNLTANAAELASFPTRVLPILTKAGCNTGACHGAAVGQGGFKLSLLGYDPVHDHEAITRALLGRRVDLRDPTESLLLLKPTLQIDHEGGRRFRRDSEEYQTILGWIGAGVPYGPAELRVTAIEVTPSDILAPAPENSENLRVTAILSDGRREDVTSLALYSSNDDAIAEVSRTGAVTVKNRGRTTVMIRYSGQVAAIRAGAPWQGSATVSRAFVPANFIDTQLLAEWNRLHIEPSAPSDDAAFLRRVSLDLAGRLPTSTEVQQFLTGTPSPTKRNELIDRLLAGSEFTELWTLKLADTLQINAKKLGPEGERAYYDWVRERVATNTPWDKLATDLLTALGDPKANGAANFARLASDPRDMGEFVSRAFLGQRIACARCHDHPFDRWTTQDFYGFAALFARVGMEKGQVALRPSGEVPYPKTGRNAKPTILGFEPAALEDNGDPRAGLAEWIARPDNPYFARSFVNRVWKEMFGRGLVEPVDDLRTTNPPLHPTLLDALAADFVRSRFDLRALLRTIALSATYQLSSSPDAGNRLDEKFFSHAYWKPIPAQVLADMLSQVTGIPETYEGYPPGTRAVQLIGPEVPSYTLDVFGRCLRTDNCDTTGLAGGSLAEALHLMNGAAVNARLSEAVKLHWLDRPRSPQELISLSFRRTLSREPQAKELSALQLAIEPPSSEGIEDLLWALMNSKEFSFNH